MTETELVLGRGELHFDRFISGTLRGEGERYIGNTTAFNVTRSYREIEQYRSIRGVLTKVDGLITEESVSGSFTTDNIVPENLVLWFGAEGAKGQDVIGFVTETFKVQRGRLYHLGRSFNGIGVRWVDDLTATIKGSPVDPNALLTIDLENGEFHVTEAGPLVDGTEIVLTFQWRTSPDAEIIASQPDEIVGALRFITKNPVGLQREYLFPYVSIKANGDAALKGDEWQQFAFDLQARRFNAAASLMYSTRPGSKGYTRDEKAILDFSGVDFQEFADLTDQLDHIINVDMPAADFGKTVTL